MQIFTTQIISYLSILTNVSQNVECPICSWVHRQDGQPPVSLSHFEAKRPTKNIVYYAERIAELRRAPELAFHSPNKLTVGVPGEISRIVMDSPKCINLDIKEEIVVEKAPERVIFESFVDSSRKKRKTSVNASASLIKIKDESTAIAGISATEEETVAPSTSTAAAVTSATTESIRIRQSPRIRK